jgi:protein-S-isoprenylcysteine O-methyltransferase Ste14
MKANIVTLIVVALTLVVLTIRYAHEPWTAMRVAAVILGLPSFVLLVLARIELGSAFSVRPKAQSLVTHGLYSRIRNPIYFFGTLTIVACFLYIRQPLYISLLVLLIPLQMYRAREEGKILEAKFGDEYRQYKAHTWF